jgi:hypothetical protein
MTPADVGPHGLERRTVQKDATYVDNSTLLVGSFRQWLQLRGIWCALAANRTEDAGSGAMCKLFDNSILRAISSGVCSIFVLLGNLAVAVTVTADEAPNPLCLLWGFQDSRGS